MPPADPAGTTDPADLVRPADPADPVRPADADQVEVAAPPRLRAVCVATAVWAVPYVVSKVHLASVGELGVAGGPVVTAADRAAYAPGGIAAAQWGNAGVGVLAVLLALAPLLPVVRRSRQRWALLVPLGALTLLTASLAVGMLAGAAQGRGGVPFGLYAAVWAALLGTTAVEHHRAGRRAGTPERAAA